MAPRARILYVDDDQDQLDMFRLAMGKEFDVSVANSGAAALELLDQDRAFAAVVSDMRMPRMNGAQLLGIVRDLSPHAARILLTADADLNSAMAAINQAYVFRYLTKPCPPMQLRQALGDAVREHERQRERDGLGRRLAQAAEGGGGGVSAECEPWAAGVLDPRDDLQHFVGCVIAGRYHISEPLGVGGTAAVYRCRDRVLEQDVAIKLFPADLGEGDQHAIRRELLLARQLSHPNIVRSHDIGVHAGRPFITMELLDGHDLVEELEDGGMDVPRALAIVRQVCEGLEHAHRQGITHRDIKPENLFVGDDGRVRIMDFGLAKRAEMVSRSVSVPLVGTVPYMSPEQIEDFQSVTHATDIYAMGIVAYELLTGRTPFEHSEPEAIVAGHLTKRPRPPSQLRTELPAELDRIVLKALAKQPEERFPSCRAMAYALAQCAGPARP